MKLTALASLLLGLAFVSPAFAADEFGARFSDNSPAALGSQTASADQDALAASLQDIAPAAGDETPAPQEAQTPAAQPDSEQLGPRAVEPENMTQY